MIDLEPVNIASHLSAMARTRPHATAVVCPAGRDRAGRPRYMHWTFQQLDRESDALARGLALIGIDDTVRTVLMVKPSLEFFALTFALFKAGAVPVLIDPGIGLKNLGHCMDQVQPGAFIGIAKAQVARQVLRWGRRTIQRSVTVGQGRPWLRVPLSGLYGLIRRTRALFEPSTLSSLDEKGPPLIGPVLDESLAGPSLAFGPCWPFEGVGLDRIRAAGWSDKPFACVPVREGKTDAILFTSGSTGPPKGTEYTHAIFAAQVEMLRSLYAIEPGEIDLCTFPLFALFAPALGMTAIIPEMDATRPAQVDPVKIIEAIEGFGVTNMFGSPALLRRVGRYGVEHGIKLPTVKRVISAGAPVPAVVLEQVAAMLEPDAQVFTPYGATEALPVCSIGSREILGETRRATDRGAGVCVGRPVDNVRLEIIQITDEPIAFWSDDLLVPDGEIGEIVVRGPNVTRGYWDRPEADCVSKILIAGEGTPALHEMGLAADWQAAMVIHSWPLRPGWFFHRMGDLGYRDDQGRIWFCGRKAHRVVTSNACLFTIPCEAVFNTHPDVARTALVGVPGPEGNRPVLCVEPARRLGRRDRERVRRELLEIAQEHAHTREIATFLFHLAFPVDIRHNAKIFREKLAVWAARQRA